MTAPLTDVAAVIAPDNLAALGVCRSLGARGVRPVVLAWDPTAPAQYSRYARRVPCPSMADESAFVAFLAELGRAQARPPVLFLTDDSALVIALRHRTRLEPLFRLPFGPWDVVERLMLKNSLYRSLDGVAPVPRTVCPDGEMDATAIAESVGFPAIVKPLLRCLPQSAPAGQDSFEKLYGSKAIRVRTEAELRQAVRGARDHGFEVVVQEEVPGPISALFSVGLYASPTELVAAFTSQKLSQVPADFGDGLVVRAAHAPDLVRLAERVVRHFGYHGLADIEFKRDPRTGAWKLLDINPRPWLWINLPAACGVDLAWAAYQGALGRPQDRAAFVQRDFETRWVSLRGVAISLVRAALAGQLLAAAAGLLRQLRGRRVGPLLCRRDPLVRMFRSPAYWWEFARQSAHGLWRLHGALGRRAVVGESR
jgi:predicted ATP-grasp superfamily ATP-dependent carboligase